MAPLDPPPQVLAMHGWAGDGSHWEPWRVAAGALGWRWRCGERGYGNRPPQMPGWGDGGPRLVVAHSLGPHLLPAELLARADAVVLLASFGRFVPPGSAGRRLRGALAGMAAALDDADQARAMLHRFLVEAAAPDPIDAMAPGLTDGPLTAEGLERLRADLRLLEHTTGLPEGFPTAAPVLIVEAGADRIVAPEARALLRQALPDADHLTLPGAGHALLRAPLLEPVMAWLRERSPGPP